METIEKWLSDYFEQIEPPVTDSTSSVPTSTIAIETTTNGSSAIVIPSLAVFIAILIQIIKFIN